MRSSPTILVIHGYTASPTGIERIAELTEVANAAGIDDGVLQRCGANVDQMTPTAPERST